jgi:hypothetical protein
MSWIVEFYRGERPDYLGRWLRDLWGWDNDRLEMIHNYIQVLFPNEQPSMFNAWAPVLDAATIAAFRSDTRLRRNLGVSHDALLRFYGLEYDPQSKKVVRRHDFEERARNWIDPFNHNYLRITRILNSLVALGLSERARAFFECLRDIYAERQADIGEETFSYWRDAVRSVMPAATEGRPSLALHLLEGTFAVCRLAPDAPWPEWPRGDLVSVTRTREELSIVCTESAVPEDVRREGDWRCLQVVGPINFAAVGVITSLVTPLSEAGISVFVLSTFDTDYLMVKDEELKRALLFLKESGHGLDWSAWRMASS